MIFSKLHNLKSIKQMETFKKGDIVKLKSGGPNMTVIKQTYDKRSGKTLTDKFDCVWFETDKPEPHYGEFYGYTLELVKEATD